MKTSEDLKYLGETLFGTTVQGQDLIQLLKNWSFSALEEETFSTSHILFVGRRYNVVTSRAFSRLVALPKNAPTHDVIEILVSCESPVTYDS
jgi:hypothetical protein